MYITVRTKFLIATAFAILWSILSLYLAEHWIADITELSHALIAWFVVFGIAIIPGFMNAFLVASLLLDKRPRRREFASEQYPAITILIAAYNEETNIKSTLDSIYRQHYHGEMKVIVVNDGSSDGTMAVLRSIESKYPWLTIIDLKRNQGKSAALNHALALVDTELTITIDGDSYLYKDALRRLVERYMSDPSHTVAVAGAVLVRNSRKNIVTKAQEWDYFHGIAAIKRLQSLYQGTLVAQGAFSLYRTSVLRELNGWAHCVGEDIVLTWAMLEQGHRVGFAEDAVLFTNAPETWRQFFNQRLRWSRGLIEAFKSHWRLLFKARMTTMFIWWNLLFPYMDIAYTFAFIPGIVLALFGIYWIAGPMTLILLPLAFIVNYIMFRVQAKMFIEQGLRVRRNITGFIFYAFLYSMILQPACVFGYIKEFFMGSVKNWGTK